jgi:hypothetical protein
MIQVVERLVSKHEALNLDPSLTKTKQNTNKNPTPPFLGPMSQAF